VSLSVQMPVDVPTGWECPRCHRVYAPRVEQCVPCSPPAIFTGPLPRPDPRRFPRPIGGFSDDGPLDPDGPPLMPVDSPHLGEEFGSRWPECHMPLTLHHDPGCSRPCGRCQERKAGDAEEARLTVRVPAYMGLESARQRARLVGEWREMFPGLQARLTPQDGQVQADVDFRLTPQDGQEHG